MPTIIPGALPQTVANDAFIESIHKAKFRELPSDFKLLSADDISYIKNNPKHNTYLPQQEKGIKPSCALPYQLYADGGFNAGQITFQISFKAGGSLEGKELAGAPFMVYALNPYQSLADASQPDFMRRWVYAVKAGDTLTDLWPLAAFESKKYHLHLYGLNGFFREFKGSDANPFLQTGFEYQYNEMKNNTVGRSILFSINNKGSEPSQITPIYNAYKTPSRHFITAPGANFAIALNFDKSYGWYDFSLRVAGHEGYEKRYAGRIETGEAGFSDPLMGKILV